MVLTGGQAPERVQGTKMGGGGGMQGGGTAWEEARTGEGRKTDWTHFLFLGLRLCVWFATIGLWFCVSAITFCAVECCWLNYTDLCIWGGKLQNYKRGTSFLRCDIEGFRFESVCAQPLMNAFKGRARASWFEPRSELFWFHAQATYQKFHTHSCFSSCKPQKLMLGISLYSLFLFDLCLLR